METNVNYTLVGAFVIFLIALLTVVILWLSTGLSFAEYNFYRVDMTESISGLNLDEPVEFNGVPVGKVQEITIDKTNPQLVKLLLKIKSSTPITQGTVATLSPRGITGITFIALEDKGTNISPLTTAPGEEYPIIKTKPSIFVRLDTVLTQMNKSLRRLSQSFKSLLSDENIDAFQRVLSSSEHFFQSGKQFLKTSRGTMQTIQGTVQTIQRQTLPAANQAADDFSNLMDNLSDVSNELKQNPSMLIRGKDQTQHLGPGE
jgi:phospholipid/cholesterol/gamma-HCH transport system substrate-binding protein